MSPSTPSPILVFDASALISWVLQTANQWQRIDRLLRSPADCVMPVSALTEAIYVVHRRGNTSSAAQLRTTLVAQGLRIEPATADDAEWAASAIIESEANPAQWTTRQGTRTGTLSLGDALTLAAATRLGGHAVTFDQAWFRFPTQTFNLINPWNV